MGRMSYEVTATRRRPQAFDALAGQEFVAETLKNALSAGKIAHAYLFAGPRGCGKTSTARILAKALNCETGPTASPCGTCRFCREITRGACTDVIEIDGASNTGVNDVRAIKDELLFPPQSARHKIYIIDEVHMLSTSAFNALLKTIEEPPSFAVFIFATTELQKVPATIKSRCQQYNFRLVSAEKITELLRAAADEMGIRADDEALSWIARESTGSVRDSYTLFDQVAAFSGDHITYEKIRDKLGLVGVEQLNGLFECCAEGRAQDALIALDGLLRDGVSVEQAISNAADYVRSLLLIKSGVTKEVLLGHSAERFSRSVLERWNAVQIERALSLLFALYRDIRCSLSPRYELELAFSRLSWLSEYVSPKEVKLAIDRARTLLAGAAPAPARQEDARPFSFGGGGQAADGLSPERDVGPLAPSSSAGTDGFKDAIVRQVMAKDKILGSYLAQTGDWTKDGGTIRADAFSPFFKMQIEKNGERLSSLVQAATGERLSFSVSVAEAEKEPSVEELPAEVRILCDVFRGRVVGRTARSEEDIARARQAQEADGEDRQDAADSSEAQDGERGENE